MIHIAYIENKNSQYGFRKQHSTQYAIVDIVNKIQASIDKKRIYLWYIYLFKKNV